MDVIYRRNISYLVLKSYGYVGLGWQLSLKNYYVIGVSKNIGISAYCHIHEMRI